MTDARRTASLVLGSPEGKRRLKRRHAAERRLRGLGFSAIAAAMLFLALMLVGIIAKGWTAAVHTHFRLEVFFDPSVIDPDGGRDPARMADADYMGLARTALAANFPDVRDRNARRDLNAMLSQGASDALRALVRDEPAIVGQRRLVWLPASSDIDVLSKGGLRREAPESERKVKDNQLTWFEALEARGDAAWRFNPRFLFGGDSREPEWAGVGGAIVGSFFALATAIVLALPIGVFAAIYLEEFAPKNRWTDFVEINTNNLAAVPSIVFGLLGLAVFLGFFDMQRSASVVGGMVLALMTLPVIIIASRAALKSVPPSIREAAMGIGASPQQVVWHHVLPLAVPGILTGAVIGFARALGESAPLLLVGMVAFVVDIPGGATEPATALPVQIYMWADSPERGFAEKAAAAILVLLAFLAVMNSLAVYLRRRYERRW
jgi:phosphate transport system permease protein